MFCHFDSASSNEAGDAGQWHLHDAGFFEARRPRPSTDLAWMVEALQVADALTAGSACRCFARRGACRRRLGQRDDVKSLIKWRFKAICPMGGETRRLT
jgi:hypothetical protein